MQDIGNAIRDDDDDGWFENATNQRVTLTLVRVDFPVTSKFLVPFELEIDDVRLPLTGPALQSGTALNIDVARRVVGTWLLQAQDQQLNFSARLLTRHPAVSGQLQWTNRAGPVTQTFALPQGQTLTLTFQVNVARFADPDPGNADADRDADGIRDREEAALAERRTGVGDPGRRDIILVPAFTHPDWAITQNSVVKLRTVFLRRGIELHIVRNENDPLSFYGRPARVQADGRLTARDHALTLNEGRQMRSQLVRDAGDPFVHFMVLAEKLENGFFGLASHPGANLVVRSHLPVLGPDVHDYQAKTIMHELGHNIGLCHPTESDETCVSGAIPPAERDVAASVMGAPTESTNQVDVLVAAIQRPMEYSPTQWTNVNLASSRQ